jgi:predicted nucleic acid-binding protein
MIVVDSLLLSGFLFSKDQNHSLAVAVRDKDPEWHCPELALSEMRSVALKQHRAGNALDVVIAAADLAPQTVLLHRLAESASVLSAAVEGKLWAYDAEYVALARKLDCRLVSSDIEILKGFPALAIHPANFIKS